MSGSRNALHVGPLPMVLVGLCTALAVCAVAAARPADTRPRPEEDYDRPRAEELFEDDARDRRAGRRDPETQPGDRDRGERDREMDRDRDREGRRDPLDEYRPRSFDRDEWFRERPRDDGYGNFPSYEVHDAVLA